MERPDRHVERSDRHAERHRSRSPIIGRPRRWDRDNRGMRRSRSRSRSPPPPPVQQARGYPHNTWEPTQFDLEPVSQPPPPPPPKVDWRTREIPSLKPQHYSSKLQSIRPA